jgi:predicted dehydrogenase
MTRVAIIGAGSMAREHIRAFSALPGVSVTGLYSRTRARAEALATEFGIGSVCDDIPSLKSKSAADLVVVAVPEISANAVAKATFLEDWAVLLEKPAGYDLADALDIADAASRRRKPVLVGFNRRFYSSTMAVLADLDSRNELRYAHIQDQQSFAEARRYNHPEPVVQKFMYANSIHVIDMMRALCRGNVVEVKQIMPWRGEETEVVLSHVAFDSGDSALYEGLWKGPGPWTCSVSTPSRRWMLQPLERAAFQNANERKQNPVEPDAADVDYKAGFLRQAEAVLGAARGAKTRAVGIAESLQTMQLINRIFGV